MYVYVYVCVCVCERERGSEREREREREVCRAKCFAVLFMCALVVYLSGILTDDHACATATPRTSSPACITQCHLSDMFIRDRLEHEGVELSTWPGNVDVDGLTVGQWRSLILTNNAFVGLVG